MCGPKGKEGEGLYFNHGRKEIKICPNHEIEKEESL